MKNKHSLPHNSVQNGNHLDVYSFVEGKVAPQKFHYELDKNIKPNSIEGLRARLSCSKGY